MAVRINAPGEFLARTSDFPQVDAIAVSLWFYMDTDRNAAGTLFTLLNNIGTVFEGAYLRSDGTTLALDVGGTVVDGSTLSPGNWYHIFYQRVGNAHTIYLNGVLDITNNTALSLTPAFMLMGSNSAAHIDGRLAAVKIWSGIGAAFDATAVQAEMDYYEPAQTSNVYAWYPILNGDADRELDNSGNNRHWTENGTLTDEADPPDVDFEPSGENTGSASLSLGVLSVSGTGEVAVSGAGSLSLGALTVSGSGVVAVDGEADLTLGVLSVTASGQTAIDGSASISLGVLTVSASGTVAISGAAALSLGALTVTAYDNLPSGAVSISITSARPTVSASVTAPTASVSVKRPSITFTAD